MPTSSSAVYSVVELLSHLCLAQDSSTHARVGALLSWLHQSAITSKVRQTKLNKKVQRTNAFCVCLQATVSKHESWSPCAAYVHAIAAILWNSHEKKVTYDLQALVTPELFHALADWSSTLPVHGALKRAIDCVLCSMCFIKPALFSELLQATHLDQLGENSSRYVLKYF
jgi:baculoviral IAP repeat-containing protein 6